MLMEQFGDKLSFDRQSKLAALKIDNLPEERSVVINDPLEMKTMRDI